MGQGLSSSFLGHIGFLAALLQACHSRATDLKPKLAMLASDKGNILTAIYHMLKDGTMYDVYRQMQ